MHYKTLDSLVADCTRELDRARRTERAASAAAAEAANTASLARRRAADAAFKAAETPAIRKALDLVSAERQQSPQPHSADARAVLRSGVPSAVRAYERGGRALTTDCIPLWTVLRAERPSVRNALLGAAGSSLSLLTCLDMTGEREMYGALGEGVSALRLDLAQSFKNVRQDGQRTLELPPCAAVGFLGYLVNLVHLSPRDLAWSCPKGSLRQTLLWSVYKDTKLFDTWDNMQAYMRSAWLGAFGTVRCLEGRTARSNGRVTGSDVSRPPSWLSIPGVPWAERLQCSLCPDLVVALAEVAAHERRQKDARDAEAAAKDKEARVRKAASEVHGLQSGLSAKSAELARRTSEADAARDRLQMHRATGQQALA